MTNSQLVIEAAEISWSSYRHRFDRPELEVRCFVSAERESGLQRTAGIPVAEQFVDHHRRLRELRLSRPDSGFSFGWVTESTVRSSEYFRQCFLDVMIYPLLEIRDLITLHAACVVYKSRGILLAGDSGAGKSSLAYACARSWLDVCF